MHQIVGIYRALLQKNKGGTTMQLVLLAAGKGSRLGLNISNKCFIKICGKCLLDYNLEMFSCFDVSEIILVVGHNAENIQKYVGKNYNGIPVTYVMQHKLLGIAHALKTVVPYIHEDFMMCLSDELFINPNIEGMLDFFSTDKVDCLCGVVKDSAENIKKAYTMYVAETGEVTQLIEKPTQIFNQWKGTGCCLMRQTMLPILEVLLPNKIRNEYEMGDWIQLAINTGLTCKIYSIADKNFNINTKQDIIVAEKCLQNM